MIGVGNPHNLRVGVIKDWESRWQPGLQIPTSFSEHEKYKVPSVVGKLKPWKSQGNNGVRNVPRKRPYHR